MSQGWVDIVPQDPQNILVIHLLHLYGASILLQDIHTLLLEMLHLPLDEVLFIRTPRPQDVDLRTSLWPHRSTGSLRSLATTDTKP